MTDVEAGRDLQLGLAGSDALQQVCEREVDDLRRAAYAVDLPRST
jgi:hypothetical protein